MSDREQFEAARAAGLKARHETRVERAIRRQVAEEIAQAIEAFMQEMASASTYDQLAMGSPHNYLLRTVELAREIGSKETS